MCHVLIVEDEPLIAMDLEELLKHEGATSFSFAASEEEAFQIAIANPPALITSDVKLISGTGPAAIKRIFEELGQIPVIFITGTPEACEPCEPPNPVIPKPLAPAAIKTAFHQLMD